MEPIIKVQNLGKQYRIGSDGSAYSTLREALVSKFRSPLNGRSRSANKKIWALSDVSFEIGPGEIVGIIGRNGAGKSTLLKILSRVTEPTTGRVELHGRVGSLLEVGTGFHPELSGRENVFLNGAILGMSRAEILQKFDDIVAFAEVEKFIDTPVKRYSSGMYVRLAFAVAAYLEPEILLVDEVLSVGDASFQRKCLDRMKDVGRHGRTVIFVSHNMPAVTRLCERTILLDGGTILQDGPSHKVVGSYLKSGLGTMAAREWADGDRPGNEIVRLCAVRVRAEDGHVSDAIDIRLPVRIEIEFEVLQTGHLLIPNIHVTNDEGVLVFIAGDTDPVWRSTHRPAGRFISTALIPGNFLSEGTMIVAAAVSTMDPVTIHFFERDAVAFQVIDKFEGDSARGDFAGTFPGVVRPMLRWTTSSVSPNDQPEAKELVQ
ncbi:MAG TPA: ABC transporter ATP-binding protein [Pyrinomonadaceae bacterium]|jgi:lipopolysaccharide transport system ATP-binding protein